MKTDILGWAQTLAVRRSRRNLILKGDAQAAGNSCATP